MSIIISQNSKNAQKIDKSNFEKEDYLQNYIHENPESIPVYEIAEDKKLLVVAREFRTESGPIDALAVDKDGDIYVVETKLYKNPDKRTVVAQALDYGASLWRHSNFDEFIAKINSEINNKFKISFEEKIKDFFNIDDEQILSTVSNIKHNLQNGNIKFVILMDSIEDRLKDLIVYVNQNSQFDIYAVQMEYYKFEQYEIMIPKLFGVEVKKSVVSTSSNSLRKKWDEQSFFEEIKKVFSGENLNSISKIYKFSKDFNMGIISWGTGMNQGSFSVKFNGLGNRPLFVVYADGRIKISTDYPKKEADKNQVLNLDKLHKFLSDTGIVVNSGSERTAFSIEEWSSKIDKIIEAIKEVLK